MLRIGVCFIYISLLSCYLLVVGTQWSPYYDFAGVADMSIAFANDFLYSNQYNLGSARAERMLSYRKGFEFG